MNISINANSVSGLATVATSGAYSDLSGKPSLAKVATSGSYNDLSNKPTISTGKVTQKFNQTFNANSSGVTKSITGLTAYKPVYIGFKSDSKCSIKLSSGFLINDTSTLLVSTRLMTFSNSTQWIACVPNGTSISIVANHEDSVSRSISIVVYQ